jgi:hypothetical protein
MSARTQAKMGRSMKKRAMPFSAYLGDAVGAGAGAGALPGAAG